MPAAPQVAEPSCMQRAADLMSQQIWCWGRDILRPDGNWLLEVGFTRTQPPADRSECPSLYTLDLPDNGRVLLRGYGALYTDPRFGAVFLPRFEFDPGYTEHAQLPCDPWTKADLPKLSPPTATNKQACHALLSRITEWIGHYETHVAKTLGVAYRRETLSDWDDGSRSIIPAQDMAPFWHELSCFFESKAVFTKEAND